MQLRPLRKRLTEGKKRRRGLKRMRRLAAGHIYVAPAKAPTTRRERLSFADLKRRLFRALRAVQEG